MHDYYGLVLKTTVLMVLTMFLIVMIMMVVAAAVVVMSQKSCSGDGTFTVRNDVHDASRNALAL